MNTTTAHSDTSTKRCGPSTACQISRPQADIYEGKSEFVLVLDTPGVVSDDVHVQLDRSALTVEAVRWLGPAVEGQERPSRTYRRSFVLPDSVDAERISAALDKGVLTLTLPKRADAAVRTIRVTPQ